MDGTRSKRVRHAHFEARSSLPISAVCVFANGARESLSALLSSPVVLRLLEPCVPTPDAWSIILSNARLYRVRGNISDAAIVLRPCAAIVLAGALFGESHPAIADRELSPIECDVLDRMVHVIAANLAAVCGSRDGRTVERVTEIRGFSTYFELLVEDPLAARIGVALSNDPPPESRGCFAVGHLAAVELDATVSINLGEIEAAAVARLAVGAMVPVEAVEFARCTLSVAGRIVARGTCGVRNNRFALSVNAAREAT